MIDHDHTIRAFDVDLHQIASMIEEMGRLADGLIGDAAEALEQRDTALAQRVIAADDRIDALKRDIEQKAIATIARRQPMAVDLREIVGALRISNELERVGDLAKGVAKRVLQMTDEPAINNALLQLGHMVQIVRFQLESVLESYTRHDVEAAMRVWHKDEEVDALNTSLFRELLTYMMENPRNIAFCTHLIFCAKNIERIGDHATNIAETVCYIVEGRTIVEERPKADITSGSQLPQLATGDDAIVQGQSH